MKIHIEQATPDKASHIASLIMEAYEYGMLSEFCRTSSYIGRFIS